MPLNCTPKSGQNGQFYVYFTTIKKRFILYETKEEKPEAQKNEVMKEGSLHPDTTEAKADGCTMLGQPCPFCSFKPNNSQVVHTWGRFPRSHAGEGNQPQQKRQLTIYLANGLLRPLCQPAFLSFGIREDLNITGCFQVKALGYSPAISHSRCLTNLTRRQNWQEIEVGLKKKIHL